jgi:hypothetical protein
MNLFFLDLDLRKAAQAHGDKHVVKMILEACQLLYTAHWVFAYSQLLECKSAVALAKAHKQLSVPASLETAPHSKTRPEEPGFRPCHIHHPCAVWVRESIENYGICARLAVELAIEFRHRYPKKGAHECEAHAHWLLQNPPPRIPCIEQTPFVQAMDDIYKRDDPIEGYRNYYRTSKRERGLLQYKNREPPPWL